MRDGLWRIRPAFVDEIPGEIRKNAGPVLSFLPRRGFLTGMSSTHD